MAIKTITFNYTGTVQTWTPPSGTVKAKIECFGAQGGDMLISPWTGKGGKGGYTCGEIELRGFKTLYIYVGGQGQGYNGSTNHPGGWNGGGTCYQGASGGGGASDVRTVIDDLNSRIIVAGGGGGANDHTNGGAGGGLTGDAGQTNGGIAGGGGTQVSGGSGWINGSFGIGGGAANAYGDGGAGGGGWYGGGKAQGYDSAGGGGSSYYGSLLNFQTAMGVNSGNGLIRISYEEVNYATFLKKDNKYYMPVKKYFDASTNTFLPVTLSDVVDQINNDRALVEFSNINNEFSIDSKIYKPFELIDLTKYKFCFMPLNGTELINVVLSFIPSKTALLKTNIKVEEKYSLDFYKLNPNDCIFSLDIVTPDKNKIDYLIDDGQSKLYKNCSILNSVSLNSDFYANFKFNSYDGLISSITLYGKNNDKYIKLRNTAIDVYNKSDSEMLVCFKNPYDEVLINKITKQSLDYTIDTLDIF